MKKIISFSLWGDKPRYINGAIWNAENAKTFYPGWTCKFYYDNTVPVDAINKIIATGAETALMDPSIKSLGLYWRFNPLIDDPQIERFIVRDTDSKFNKRESDMVKEWIKSNKSFHIIRDNKQHDVPIPGGTWGSKSGTVPDYESRFKFWSHIALRKNANSFYGTDQLFLRRLIWPIAISDHIAHVLANEPKLKITGNEIEVSPPSDGHFVGMPYL